VLMATFLEIVFISDFPEGKISIIELSISDEKVSVRYIFF